MTRNFTLLATDRLLVFAPHPDDETLATGELIQLAVRVGAAVRVVFATDGDNNPWPQRWFERRLRIGTEERARWGERRRGEARSALKTLGVDDASTRFLGWPDLGLTGMLVDDQAIDVLVDEVSAFAPTHVAMPSLRDRHPDHGALRVMVDLALAKSRSQSVRLGYVVHGRTADADGWRLEDDATRHQCKRDALMAHTSQIGLSRRRLLGWADQPESFDRAESESALAASSPSADRILRIPLLPAYRFWRQHDLLVVLGARGKVECARIRLPRFVRTQADGPLADGLCSGRVHVELMSGVLQITFAATTDATATAYVKLERTWPRLIIFDAETWQRLEDFPTLPGTDAQHASAVRVPQRASI
jgi:LmbE family N-acetylglucosaminyl deacetylase